MGGKVYDNRELSWIKFNERVLEEARDNSVPLMERLLFESIYCSNLDEFFMVRVGSLFDAALVNDKHKDGKSKMRPSEQLEAIYKRVRELVKTKDLSFREICDELKLKGISYKKVRNLGQKDLEFLESYIAYEIKPFLNVLIIDKRQPFPFLPNKSINVFAKLSSKSGNSLGIITGLEKFERVIYLPSEDGKVRYVLAEDLISHYASKAFLGYKIEEKTLVRITRNADINVDESFDREIDFRENMSELIKKRKRLCPIRLQLSKNISDSFLSNICDRVEIAKKQCFVENSPADFSFVFKLFEKTADRKNLFFDKLVPQKSPMIDETVPMIQQIDKKDLFLSYPYESIEPFIRLLNEAAKAPDVVSIKMTLYRVAKNSKVIKALRNAAENGKEVTVLVELRARFDEENNIEWSRCLEESGCNVLYGPQGFKVHSKLCLITRKTSQGAAYTVQVGTGNYNEKTAELYTDLCLMTSDREIAADAEEVFRCLAMGEFVEKTGRLLVAPHCLQNRVLKMMDDEIAVVKAGGEGYVGAKLNSLTDKLIIDKLIECSQAGVKVELVIRGISCLVAGVSGVTDNIHIRSIVGRYLEHARIYVFGSGSRKKVYVSSADYMTRNTTRRVEVAVPLLDETIKKRALDIFDTQLRDNVKARVMQPDGSYIKAVNDSLPLNAQEHFFKEAYLNAPKDKPKTEDTPSAEPAVSSAVEEPPPKVGFFRRILNFFKRK